MQYRLAGYKNSQLLAKGCSFIGMSGYCHDMLSVVWLSSVVTRGYCGRTAEVRTTRFHWNVAQYLSSAPAKFDDEIRREFPRSGAQTRVRSGVVFDFAMHAIFRKRCEIEPTWQLTTNCKSYRLSIAIKVDNLEWPESQFTALTSELCVLWLNGRG